MKSRTIRVSLRASMKTYIESIRDQRVRGLVERDLLVCGGAIASMLANEKVNDFDIYFKTIETVKAVAQYYVDEFNVCNKALSTHVTNCEPTVRELDMPNCRGEIERRVIIYIKSAGVAGETQESYQYFESQPEASANEFVESLNIDQIKAGQEMNEILKAQKGKYRPVFFSDNAITLSDKVQLVLRFYGEPSEIHDNYDYAHAMCSYDYANDILQLHPEALESILGRNLVYKGSLYPIASLFRIRKFLKRGWSITAGQMLKIVWQVNDLKLDDPAVLRDQLIGVDVAYMAQLLSVLKNKEPGVRVDSTYIAKIIDEIFD